MRVKAAGENGIFQPRGKELVWSPTQWRAFLEECLRDGWEGVQVEFRHRVFEPNQATPQRTVFIISGWIWLKRMRLKGPQ